MKVLVSIAAFACLLLPAAVYADAGLDAGVDAGEDADGGMDAGAVPQVLPGGECLACHSREGDEVAELWQNDVHAQAGIGCVDCHGGDNSQDDKALAKGPGSGYRGTLSHRQIPLMCGGCHGDASYMRKFNPLLPVDQLVKYRTSQHGHLLAKGDQKVAECASCHGAHGIREINDARAPVYPTNIPDTCGRCHADPDYMSDYDIPTTQYEDYIGSVHGKDLLEKGDVRGAPACNDCHGSHGARPPAIADITHICGTCHAYNAELFLDSPLAPAFKEKSLADCVACHGKHKITHVSDDWLGEAPGTVCRKCHEEDDKGAELAIYLADTLGEIRQSADDARALLDQAEEKGMDVSEGEDDLEAAREGLLQTRTLVHSFSRPVIDKKVQEIMLNQEAAAEVAMAAFDEIDERRRGLGISTILLILLALFVAIKIRTLPPLK